MKEISLVLGVLVGKTGEPPGEVPEDLLLFKSDGDDFKCHLADGDFDFRLIADFFPDQTLGDRA
jgi:hypothetical protein